MNKPPGYYRDERGREYYWDGRQRSYIPNDSFGRFMADMNRVTLGVVGFFVLLFGGIVLLFVLGMVLWAVGVTVWAILRSPLILLLLIVAGLLIYWVIKHGPRWDKN